MARVIKKKSDKAELRKIANREANERLAELNKDSVNTLGIESHKRPSKALRQYFRANLRDYNAYVEAENIAALSMHYADTDSISVKTINDSES